MLDRRQWRQSRREVVSGVDDEEFTYDYVSDKVDEVYSTFDKDEIDELLNKIKSYNDSKEN